MRFFKQAKGVRHFFWCAVETRARFRPRTRLETPPTAKLARPLLLRLFRRRGLLAFRRARRVLLHDVVQRDHLVELEVRERAVVVDLVALPSRLLELLRVRLVVRLEARDDLEGLFSQDLLVGARRLPTGLEEADEPLGRDGRRVLARGDVDDDLRGRVDEADGHLARLGRERRLRGCRRRR